jgi:hypothetical protein
MSELDRVTRLIHADALETVAILTYRETVHGVPAPYRGAWQALAADLEQELGQSG